MSSALSPVVADAREALILPLPRSSSVSDKEARFVLYAMLSLMSARVAERLARLSLQASCSAQ